MTANLSRNIGSVCAPGRECHTYAPKRLRNFSLAGGRKLSAVLAACWRRLETALLSLAITLVLFHGVAHSAGAPAPTEMSTSLQSEVAKLPVVDRQDIRFVQVSADGAPFQGWVVSIAQDNRGFVWLAAFGLYRYDGYSLRSYRHDAGDPDSLSDDTVRVVFKDKDGLLWVGTSFGGLDRLDPTLDKFTHYRHNPGDERTLSDDNVACIYQDRAGALWIGTNGGLDRLDPARGTFIH